MESREIAVHATTESRDASSEPGIDILVESRPAVWDSKMESGEAKPKEAEPGNSGLNEATSEEVESAELRSAEPESSERTGRAIDSSNAVDPLALSIKNMPDEAKGREKVTEPEIPRPLA
jgi:hypothetical protein